MLDRRQERSDRRREHITELNKRATEADLRLKRLCDAIETGVANLSEPGLKERVAGLQAIRDQSQADAIRAQAALDSAAQQPIIAAIYASSPRWARRRMRIEGGGYCRDRLRALAQQVEVADHEVCGFRRSRRALGEVSAILRGKVPPG